MSEQIIVDDKHFNVLLKIGNDLVVSDDETPWLKFRVNDGENLGHLNYFEGELAKKCITLESENARMRKAIEFTLKGMVMDPPPSFLSDEADALRDALMKGGE